MIQGKIGRNEAERIASGSSPTISSSAMRSSTERWDAKKGMKPYVPRVTGEDDPRVEEIDLNVPDSTLMEISSQGILALTLEEMKAIQAHINDPAVIEARKRVGLGDKITDVELEVPRPDLVRALQAQDLQRPHHLRGGGRKAAGDRFPLFTPTSRAPRRRSASGWAPTTGASPSSPTTPASSASTTTGTSSSRWRPTTPPRRSTPTAARSPASSASTAIPSAPARGPSSSSIRTSSALPPVLRQAASEADPAPAADLRGGARGGGARRQQERHPHGERLHRLRRALSGQAPRLLRHRGDHARRDQRRAVPHQRDPSRAI